MDKDASLTGSVTIPRWKAIAAAVVAIAAVALIAGDQVVSALKW
jgi:hypothetical protein